MTLVGRDQQEFLKRREASREAATKNPRSPGAAAMTIMKNLAKPTVPGYFTEGPMLKAQCKRLANRAHVINNTVFRFDKNGITRIVNQANVLYDFQALLRMNGVVELDPETEQPKPSDHMHHQQSAAPAAAPVVESKPKYEAPTVKEVPAAVLEEESESEPDLVVGAVDKDEPAEESKPVDKDNRRKPAKK